MSPGPGIQFCMEEKTWFSNRWRQIDLLWGLLYLHFVLSHLVAIEVVEHLRNSGAGLRLPSSLLTQQCTWRLLFLLLDDGSGILVGMLQNRAVGCRPFGYVELLTDTPCLGSLFLSPLRTRERRKASFFLPLDWIDKRLNYALAKQNPTIRRRGLCNKELRQSSAS